MRLTMADRKSLAHVFVERYHYASKIEKICILNEFVDYTGFNRNYAARVLRKALQRNDSTSSPGKHLVKYDTVDKAALEKLWKISDYIPELIRKYQQFQELDIPETTKKRLGKISRQPSGLGNVFCGFLSTL